MITTEMIYRTRRRIARVTAASPAWPRRRKPPIIRDDELDLIAVAIERGWIAPGHTAPLAGKLRSRAISLIYNRRLRAGQIVPRKRNPNRF